MDNPIKIFIAKNGLSEEDVVKAQQMIELAGLDNVELKDASEIPADAQIVDYEELNRKHRARLEQSVRSFEIHDPYIPFANYSDGRANRRARREKERQNKKRK